MKIGCISDTHGVLPAEVFDHFKEVDEIWHAGDFGTIDVVDQLQLIAPVVGVYGNVDGYDIRAEYPEHMRFTREGMDIWMTHIGGVPGRYSLPIKEKMESEPPNVFVCGHSHMLKVARDPKLNNMIYINPGAAGIQGFHQKRTLMRFECHDGQLTNMEVIDLGFTTNP
ncbi:MAG: metallophosphoesterase family protein [Balneolaceae bacterium]|nr:metallophosphoesterase family protein [Balneolaceae bacterium]MDR9446119.1 metallophosphoesterase family protein [Balneolaceae bacterium]